MWMYQEHLCNLIKPRKRAKDKKMRMDGKILITERTGVERSHRYPDINKAKIAGQYVTRVRCAMVAISHGESQRKAWLREAVASTNTQEY
ncbi:hypothetical protein M514_04040, partial [Trichuris suis]